MLLSLQAVRKDINQTRKLRKPHHPIDPILLGEAVASLLRSTSQ